MSLADAMKCPTWCNEDPRHGYSAEERRLAGGLMRQHSSSFRTVIERPEQEPQHPVTLRLEHFVQVSNDGEEYYEPPVIILDGIPDCGLTAAEAAKLAEALAEAAATFSSVVTA